MLKKAILIALLIITFQFKGNAWVYPEHRDIMLLVFLKLDLPQVMWLGSGAMPPIEKARMTITTNMVLRSQYEMATAL